MTAGQLLIGFKTFMLRNKKGFTLIEVILMIVMIGIMSGVTAKVLLAGLDVYELIVNRKDAFEHSRMGMERMTDELMTMTTSELFGPEQLNITRSRSTQICFYNDLGYRSFVKGTTYGSIPVIYLRENRCLTGTSSTDHELVGNLAYLNFSYTSMGGYIKRIGIEYSVQALGGAGTIWMRSAVFPRNLMYYDFE